MVVINESEGRGSESLGYTKFVEHGSSSPDLRTIAQVESRE